MSFEFESAYTRACLPLECLPIELLEIALLMLDLLFEASLCLMAGWVADLTPSKLPLKGDVS
jgi:hypothetical protein